MNPVCSVRNPITHMMALLTAATTQPCQYRLPIRTVEPIVSTQEM
jgi:hypothetical protein